MTYTGHIFSVTGVIVHGQVAVWTSKGYDWVSQGALFLCLQSELDSEVVGPPDVRRGAPTGKRMESMMLGENGIMTLIFYAEYAFLRIFERVM